MSETGIKSRNYIRSDGEGNMPEVVFVVLQQTDHDYVLKSVEERTSLECVPHVT